MSEKSFLRRNWKLLLNVVTILALVVFIYAIRGQIIDTFQNLDNVKWWILLLIIPLELWNYDAQTRLYGSLFMIVGNKFNYRHMYETAVELNFVNNVFPSGGVSGISYFALRMRSENVTAGKATLIQIMKLILLILSFEILLAIALLLLAAEGRVNDVILLITAVLSTLMIVGTALFAYVLGSKQRVDAFFVFVRTAVNTAAQKFMKNPGNYQLERLQFLLQELHSNFATIKSRYKELKKPLLFAMMANISEMLVIYVVYVAFGEWVNFGAIILAYSVANFAGLVSILPGGVGIYEALMTGVLVAAGVPVGLSVSATIMFRVLSSLVQLPPGYYFYHRTLRTGNVMRSDAV